MGGAGAGAGGFVFLGLIFGGPVIWLAAGLTAWILVLPKWTFAACISFVVSCGLYAALWYARPGSVLNEMAVFGSFFFSVTGLLAIPAALVFRIMTVFSILKADRNSPRN